jgi:hypothetical protein
MATNRFTKRKENIQTYNESDALLEIMRAEFPNDEYYKNGYLTPNKMTATIQPVIAATDNNVTLATRNDNNIVVVSKGVTEFVEYTVNKSIPTINENALDDLLDDEWEYFTQPGQLRQPTTSGVFLIAKEIQLNPIDFHHEYIVRGPETIISLSSYDNLSADIFCVYYINNDVAYPIPNYKTLEVMLVERGLTYSTIIEASIDDMQKYDMVFDGKFEGDQTPTKTANPVEEFNFRKLPDRTLEWNERIRFDSGYKPKAPFKRDPGDYLKPIGYRGTGASDVYINEDPDDRYFDLVFQGQTYKEKLREKYEGKMVIDKWPVPYNNDVVVGNQSITIDDLVLGVRLMINGYWKGIALASEGGSRVFETYAQLNGYSLKDFQVGQGRYSERGYINLFLEQGGLTVLHVQEDERPSVVWDDFAHIAEVDRLDTLEYEDYINNQSNNGQPFDIEYLNPYEPKGSIRYYKQSQLDKLQMQAAEQAEFDSIKEQILEYWPMLATKTEEFRNRLNGIQNGTYESYFVRMLGDDCPAYKIINAGNYWKFVKKKKDELKTKEEEKNLFSLIEKANIITLSISRDQEDRLVNYTNWGVVVDPAGEAGIDVNVSDSTGGSVLSGLGIGALGAGAAAGTAGVVAATTGIGALGVGGAVAGATAAVVPVGTAIAAGVLLVAAGVWAVSELRELDNVGKYQLPRNSDNTRFKKLMKRGEYVNLMIAKVLEERITNSGVRNRLTYADAVIGELRETIAQASDLLLTIDQRLLNATEASELSDIYTSIMEFYTFLNNINNDDLQYCIDTNKEIDSLIRQQLVAMYDAVENFRKIVHDNVGSKGKYGIQWPESAKLIINSYLPGKTFDNYLPTEDED